MQQQNQAVCHRLALPQARSNVAERERIQSGPLQLLNFGFSKIRKGMTPAASFHI